MGLDIASDTVRILEEGLGPPPSALERGQTAAFARWVREPHGAVLFIRRWRNDQYDTDCAITSRDSKGSWAEPTSWGGGGCRDPFDRPVDGWGGEPVVWEGEAGTMTGPEYGEVLVRVYSGMASRSVAYLDVLDQTERAYDRVWVRDDTGVFLVGVVGVAPYSVVPRGVEGAPLLDAKGREHRRVLASSHLSPYPEALERLIGPDGAASFDVGLDSEGRLILEVAGRGSEIVEDPELIEYFREQLRDE